MSYSPQLDPVLVTVLANRLEAIVREMTNTLQRAAFSPGMSMSRDFSCAIATDANELLASAEGLPVHIYGTQLQTESMCRLHPDLAEGDAFLHNDVYLGNSHAADHSVLVPVFVDGEHMFTANAKGHLADVGNSLPTTYMVEARDVYAEGAPVFPCVRIQRGYEDVSDVIRMCRSRIRVPDQWFGDYQAILAAGRIAERRLKELVSRYGKDTIRRFVREWFDYSERRMMQAIREVPDCHLVGEGFHDAFPGVPDGFPIRIEITVDSAAARMEVDLSDNIDCVEAGINSSVACAMSSVFQGIFSVLNSEVPHNAGSFRRVDVKLRENCLVGIPRFPASCSLATTDPANRLINLTQATFAQICDGWGLAEGGLAHNPGWAVISGTDPRRGDAPFVNQLVLGNNGGPAAPTCDGWLTWATSCIAGLVYRDSVEVDEQRFPIRVRSIRLLQDSAGAGRFRGAPGLEVVYGPTRNTLVFGYPAEGHETPARGVRGGRDGSTAAAFKADADGVETQLPAIYFGQLHPGECVRAVDNSGGGYGDPLLRDPARVLADVLEGWVSMEHAAEAYGVILRGDLEDESLAVDEAATSSRRQARRAPSDA